MTIVRLRTEVADERGRLGQVASIVAACRGNILGVDVHLLDGRRVANELIVEFPDWSHGEAATAELELAGAVNLHVEKLGEHAVVDPMARAIGIAALVFVDEEACVGQLVGADRARLLDDGAARASPAAGLLLQAAESGAPIVIRQRVLSEPSEDAELPPWTLVVPHVAGSRRRLMVVERNAPAFSSSEVARISALLGLANAALLDARALAQDAVARVGPPRLLRRRPASFPFRSSSSAGGVPIRRPARRDPLSGARAERSLLSGATGAPTR